MKQIIISCLIFVIFVEIILLIKGHAYEQYEFKHVKNDDADAKLQLTTCRRCKNQYNNVWAGYQTANTPPTMYWPDKTNAEGLQTKTWQNYKTLDSPLEKTFQSCDDAYRCRQYGVATGVQGKIF
jgi:hypothetical protein